MMLRTALYAFSFTIACISCGKKTTHKKKSNAPTQSILPSNTGNLIRLAANIGVSLHLIHPLGFDLENANLRRAGLDYSDLSEVHEHKEFSDYVSKFPGRRLIFFTAGLSLKKLLEEERKR